MKRVGILMSFLEEGEAYEGPEALNDCAEFGKSG